jgi:hypothetical protein
MLRILDLLDVIKTRLEQIEARMGELWKEDEAGKRALAGVTPARIQGRPN